MMTPFFAVDANILEDHRVTLSQLAEELKISVGFVDKQILHDHLHMRKLSFTVDTTDGYTILKAGTSQLMPEIFENGLRKGEGIFRQTYHTGRNMGPSL